MHGGGNTSVKLTETDLFGRSGRRAPRQGLGHRSGESSPSGVSRRSGSTTCSRWPGSTSSPTRRWPSSCGWPAREADAPAPSVEAILHAILPARYVDHTHADAVLAITNTPSGRKRIEELYGDRSSSSTT